MSIKPSTHLPLMSPLQFLTENHARTIKLPELLAPLDRSDAADDVAMAQHVSAGFFSPLFFSFLVYDSFFLSFQQAHSLEVSGHSALGRRQRAHVAHVAHVAYVPVVSDADEDSGFLDFSLANVRLLFF